MIVVEEDRIEKKKIVGGLNQGLEEMKNVKELNQELKKKNVREPDLNHEKKIVEERDQI
jgi:hypothetical protein